MYVYSVCQIHDPSRNPHRNPMPCIFMYPLNRHLHGPTVYMRIFGKKPIRMAPSTHGTSRREPQEVCISFRRIRHFGRSSIFILFWEHSDRARYKSSKDPSSFDMFFLEFSSLIEGVSSISTCTVEIGGIGRVSMSIMVPTIRIPRWLRVPKPHWNCDPTGTTFS